MEWEEYQTLSGRKKFYRSHPWRVKRQHIIVRDNKECQWCKLEGKVTTTDLVVHHIQELKDRPDLRMDDDNLITVCFNCHEVHHGRIKEPSKWDGDEMW